MNYRTPIILLFVTCFFTQSFANVSQREMPFDDNWKFSLQDAKGAEKPSFNDKTWRSIDLPHDWSIENIVGSKEVLANGGQVHSIPFLFDTSTTKLVTKIRDHGN